MQHFGITRQHVGNIHFLSAKAFARAGERGIKRDHLQHIGTLNGGIRLERSDHIRVFLAAVSFNRAYCDRRIPPIGIILHGTQRTVNAVGRTNHHGLILARTFFAAAMQPLTHLPTGNHFQKERDDRGNDKCRSWKRKFENKRNRAIRDNSEQRSVDDLRVQLIALRHHMPMVCTDDRKAQYPNGTEANKK